MFDPWYSTRKFAARISGLSYGSRFPHIKFKVSDPDEAERVFSTWAL